MSVLGALRSLKPDQPAIADQQRSYSVEALLEQIAENRGQLRETLGDLNSPVVGIMADNGCSWAIADLALMDSGYTTVPLPLFFSIGQLQHVIEDANIGAILTDRAQLIDALQLGFQTDDTPTPCGLTLMRRPTKKAANLPIGTQKITYTSGTTGQPKGVCLSQRHLETVTDSISIAVSQLNLRRHLCLLPLSTLLENIAGLYTALQLGAECIVLPTAALSSQTAYPGLTSVIRAIENHRPNSLILVPQLLQMLVSAAERGWRVPDSLRFIAVGGAHVAPELLKRAEHVGLPVYEGYGLSECGSVVSLNRPGAFRLGSCGQLLPHVAAEIADDGEIVIREPRMLGYVGDSAEPIGQTFATGDLGRIDADGFVHIEGRKKDIFITAAGRNVSPAWVEAELSQESEIISAAVFGEARPFNVALIYSDADRPLINAAVDRANARLPDYAQIKAWRKSPQKLTASNGMLTPSGEPRRELLAERYTNLLTALYSSRPSSHCA